MHTRKEQMEAFGRFLDVLDELREKCPWDRKQTNESLRPNTIEETYELCDALMKDDKKDICKELADQDRAIRKDEPYQLSGTVDHRSHHILQLGIPPLGCMRPHSQLRPRNLLHRRSVRILHMVGEASQERTFR